MFKKLLSFIAIAALLVGDVGAKGYSSGGSSRSSSSSSSSRSSYSPSRSSSSSPSRSSYSSSSSSKSYSSRPSSSSYASSSKPSSSSSSYKSSSSSSGSSPRSSSSGFFDSGATHAAREVASQKSFQKSKEVNIPRPASNYSTTRAKEYSIPSSAPQVTHVTHVHHYPVVVNDYGYRNRSYRSSSFYGGYVSRPYVSYRDPINSAFWWWMLDQSIEERAMWAYHHRNSIDAARYQAILNSDVAIQGRIAALEAQQLARNVDYVPTALASNQDLMLSDQYVKDNYKATPSSSGRFAFWFFMIPLIIAIVGGTFWMLFVKKW